MKNTWVILFRRLMVCCLGCFKDFYCYCYKKLNRQVLPVFLCGKVSCKDAEAQSILLVSLGLANLFHYAQ